MNCQFIVTYVCTAKLVFFGGGNTYGLVEWLFGGEKAGNGKESNSGNYLRDKSVSGLTSDEPVNG